MNLVVYGQLEDRKFPETSFLTPRTTNRTQTSLCYAFFSLGSRLCLCTTSKGYHHSWVLLVCPLRYVFTLCLGNPVNHFPVYEPSAERVAEIAKAHAEENNPLNMHYDAAQEVRAKGAGFYQFSGDEETRRAQMEELKSARQETEKTRQETGAVDVKPGEVEGMRENDAAGAKSRAVEKRKRELEERRKMVEAKRRKVKHGTDEVAPAVPLPSTAPSLGEPESPAFTAAAADPFAALEAKAAPGRKKGKGKAIPVPNEADAFLAQLEHDFLTKKGK